METPLLVLFENSGLIAERKPVLKRIRKATLTQIADICEQSCDISSHENVQSEPSIFFHTASAALGGGREPCASYQCRLQKVKELAQFAALYSDKVYIRNFFADYISRLETKDPKDPRDRIVADFAKDLLVFSALLPLIEVGKVQLVTFQGICPHCLSLEALHQNAKNEFDKASEDLRKRYYREVNYSLNYEEGVFTSVASGPEELLPPHGTTYFIFHDPTGLLTKAPHIAEKAKSTGEVKLTTLQAKRIKAGEIFYEAVIASVAFELGGAHFLKTSYLSDSDLEVNFIRSLSSDPIARRHTMLMRKYLTCLLPFIDSVDTSSLIRLRESEHEAFTLFRAALTRAINEYKSHGSAFTERDAQAVYADIIQPRLATLDAKVRSAKRSFRKEGVRKVLGWTGAISVGLYTGIFTANPVAGAAAFGAAKAGVELLESIMSKSDVKETIKQDDMYFLWRVKELADARSVGTQHYPHFQSQITKKERMRTLLGVRHR